MVEKTEFSIDVTCERDKGHTTEHGVIRFAPHNPVDSLMMFMVHHGVGLSDSQSYTMSLAGMKNKDITTVRKTSHQSTVNANSRARRALLHEGVKWSSCDDCEKKAFCESVEEGHPKVLATICREYVKEVKK